MCSCSEYSPEVDKALKMAGDNKGELIKVLQYYKNQNNKEKLEAAEFLISNLPYNYSYDTTNLYKYLPVYKASDSILKLKNVYHRTSINRVWDKVKNKVDAYSDIYSKPIIEDIKVIKSNYIINNIELAYTTWKQNPYAKDSISFNDFCEYILPYRQIQGKSIESWRNFFSKNNKNRFKDLYPLPLTKACDSLFTQYNDFVFDWGTAPGLPFLKFADFMQVKRGKCPTKTWLNTYIVNSEGIPMASDFVPAWGTKEHDHQWNALIYGGKTIYFESYWEKGHVWNYKNVYNNLLTDDYLGKVRLPKVFRNTYSTNIKGPISDNNVKIENIPSLFKNVKIKDVSDQYFKAEDVILNLPKGIPKDTYYAYLCVLGVNKQWVPVQWGKLSSNKIIFEKMGADIVYQPAFFKNGKIVPFSNPFYLDYNGNKKEFIPSVLTHNVTLKRKYPAKLTLLKDANLLKGAAIQASNSKLFKTYSTLETISFEPELRPYTIDINAKYKYRYYRLYSKKKITVKEIKLLSRNSENGEFELEGKLLSNLPYKIDSIFYKVVDLGSPKKISKLIFTPPNNLNHVLKGLNYELFYVDKGNFISLGIKQAKNYELSFNNVPRNTLLYLKCLDEGRQERVFEYKEGNQIWY